ncbi:mannose-1-phosphate guanylyltransferase [Pseudactinotalea sp. Z1732]|uniref:mannose-1-phosphate guanylyltransferase n=1 Tax=Micrococcales TaxID=85006 RepID=UPI003C7A48F1
MHAIIPAGGAGTRLWPLSRRDHPKFLHDLTGTGRSLLQATIDRMTPLARSVTVVTGDRHAQSVREQLPQVPAEAVLAEPAPRDSMAAIGLAAAVLARRHGGEDVIVGSFAADHVITDEEAFAEAVGAAEAAAAAGYVATIGVEASSPSTAFGYIEAGAELTQVRAGLPVHRVAAFTEKPDVDTATAYLATGRYRWNAGMFVVAARVLLDHLARHQPDLAAGLDAIAAAWDGPEREQVLARHWAGLPAISIDHAIAEPVAARGGVAVVPASFGWDDVGDWASIRAVLGPAGADAAVRVLGDADRVLALDAPGGMVVPGSGRTVVLVGVPDAVVVDTPDAILVTTAAHAQRVKDAVAALARPGADHLL